MSVFLLVSLFGWPVASCSLSPSWFSLCLSTAGISVSLLLPLSRPLPRLYLVCLWTSVRLFYLPVTDPSFRLYPFPDCIFLFIHESLLFSPHYYLRKLGRDIARWLLHALLLRRLSCVSLANVLSRRRPWSPDVFVALFGCWMTLFGNFFACRMLCSPCILRWRQANCLNFCKIYSRVWVIRTTNPHLEQLKYFEVGNAPVLSIQHRIRKPNTRWNRKWHEAPFPILDQTNARPPIELYFFYPKPLPYQSLVVCINFFNFLSIPNGWYIIAIFRRFSVPARTRVSGRFSRTFTAWCQCVIDDTFPAVFEIPLSDLKVWRKWRRAEKTISDT